MEYKLMSGSFHCLFCHGYEERGVKSAGVLAIDDCAAAKAALLISRFANRLADEVVIYTHGNKTLTAEIEKVIAQSKLKSRTRRSITVDSRKIVN
jgi:hypothetical protein